MSDPTTTLSAPVRTDVGRLTPIAEFIWRSRYRARLESGPENSVDDTWRRVAQAAAAIEQQREEWADRFLSALRTWQLLPGGRILAGAGLLGHRTLANCFVMGTIDDSVEGIFEALREGAVTLQQGGGIGYDFSTLRPRGTPARLSGATASGPVSFMRLFNQMSATLSSQGPRGGAMMGTLRCDHPDIEEFINAKLDGRELNQFNLSVLITDEFMTAVNACADWLLVFPLADPDDTRDESVMRHWSGAAAPQPCRVVRRLPAVKLWEAICASARSSAEPGLLFIDRINASNNLGYRERICATNPCAEAPLPPFGACHLASINLPAFVVDAFGTNARLDTANLGQIAGLATRFLDNIVSICRYPLYHQAQEARATRRIGIGITGLADALAMLRLRYDSDAGRAAAARILTVIRDHAFMASIELARERGTFPAYDATAFGDRPYVRNLPGFVRDSLARHGLRNGQLLSIAPAGTISLLAGNVSSGVEPIYALSTVRYVKDAAGIAQRCSTTDFAYDLWRSGRSAQTPLPDYFATSSDISPDQQLRMNAALQPLVDGSISKTVTLPRDASVQDISRVFLRAQELRLKSCAVYRQGSRSGAPLDPGDIPPPHCLETECTME